ncbi:Uu.00g033030.m01.CDS01 [Anthostomella pinea]|uniref:Uu.00g033030.m01.CDS01 n=1 Tax=Anthostomella pinea TaxID=933095 RepID=A0AAI8V8T2_9PEZI|nr:Uu.00g033030.m01.CDS01 [Anthostomella pinea]
MATDQAQEHAQEQRHSSSALDSGFEHTEASPLLQDHPRRPAHRTGLSVASIASIAKLPKAHRSNTIVNLLCLIIFIATSAGGFVAIPYTRLVEDVLCHQYYDVESMQPIDENLCKENTIQSKLAFIIAIGGAIDAIVGFLAAFPWGLVADRFGRKPVSALAIAGLVMGLLWTMAVVYFHNALQLEAVWLASAGSLLGGGNAVLIGVILSMISDATNEEERAIAFMRTHVCSLGGNLLSPALASAMMIKTGPWPPLWVAVALQVVSAVSFLFLPETLPHKRLHGNDEATEPANLKSRMSRYRESLSMLKSPSLVLLLLTALVTGPVAYSTLQFMVQFISKRYSLRLYETGYVQAAFGVAQVVQALIILPWWSRFLLKETTPATLRAPGEHHRDLSISRWSFAILTIGVMVLGLSPTLASFIFGLMLMALGSGFNSLARSVMSLYVDPEHRSRLFSLVGMVDVLGVVYAQPMLAGLFALGLKLGGGWIGLPYYGLAVLVATAGSLLLFVRLPGTGQGLSPAHEDENHQD